MKRVIPSHEWNEWPGFPISSVSVLSMEQGSLQHSLNESGEERAVEKGCLVWGKGTGTLHMYPYASFTLFITK